MADKAITRRLKIFVNGQEVDATITNLRKNLAKFRALANKQIEGTDKFKEYNAEVARLEKEYDEARKAQKEFREDLKLTEAGVSDSEKKLAEFTRSFATLRRGLRTGDLFDIKEGFQGVRKSIRGAANAALSFVSTPLGFFVTLTAGLLAAGRQLLNYNKAIAPAVKLTKQLTGFEGDELEEFRASVQATADTFDKEFNEVLRSANSLSKQMKISQQEALDLINQGFVRGADSSGDFLDKLREYPVQFKNAGFTAQDFIDIATQEVKGGIYDDKLLDTLKEANLALKEFTTSTEEALINAFGEDFAARIKKGVATGELTTKSAIDTIIKETDRMGLNLQQKQQLIADVFKGAGEDAGGFGEIIIQLNEAFNEQNKELDEIEKAELRLVQSTGEYEKALADLFDASQSGFPAMLKDLESIGNEILTNILVGLKSMFTSIEQLKQQAGLEGQSQAVKDISNNIKEFGTTAAEEARIQAEATKKNIARISREIEDLPYYKNLRGNKKILEKKLAEQEAYLKELNAIAKGESQAFIDFQKSLESPDQKGLNGGDTRLEVQKKADELAAKQRAKVAAERKKERDRLLLEILKLEEQALLAKLDLDEREIQEIRNKFSKLLELAEAGSEEEAKLLKLQQAEIDAKKLEQERKFQEEKEKVRLKYSVLTNEEKQAEELAALKKLYDSKLLSEEEYQRSKNAIEEAFRIKKEEEELKRKELEEQRIEEEFEAKLESEALNDQQRYEAELDRLKELLDAKFISQQEYEARVSKLQLKNLESRFQKSLEFIGALDNVVQSAKTGELNAIAEVTRKKGESEEDFVKRKEEAERKKKDINKKYALSELLITVGKTAANTALAIIRAYSDLGPIAGTIAAALVGTVGALQTKNAREEYKRVRSLEIGGETFSGPSSGGLDGRGGRLAILHPNEYVIPKFVRQDPEVPQIIDYLERKRKRKVGSFESGGESDNPKDTVEIGMAGGPEMFDLMSRLMFRLEQPLKVTFTLEDEMRRQELEEILEDSLNEAKGN